MAFIAPSKFVLVPAGTEAQIFEQYGLVFKMPVSKTNEFKNGCPSVYTGIEKFLNEVRKLEDFNDPECFRPAIPLRVSAAYAESFKMPIGIREKEREHGCNVLSTTPFSYTSMRCIGKLMTTVPNAFLSLTPCVRDTTLVFEESIFLLNVLQNWTYGQSTATAISAFLFSLQSCGLVRKARLRRKAESSELEVQYELNSDLPSSVRTLDLVATETLLNKLKARLILGHGKSQSSTNMILSSHLRAPGWYKAMVASTGHSVERLSCLEWVCTPAGYMWFDSYGKPFTGIVNRVRGKV